MPATTIALKRCGNYPHCGSYEFLSNVNYISAVFKLREMSAIGWAKYIGNIERILQEMSVIGRDKYIGNTKSAIGWDAAQIL